MREVLGVKKEKVVYTGYLLYTGLACKVSASLGGWGGAQKV